MTINQPDLSFTKNPEWMAEREQRWKPIEQFLKEDNRLARVNTIKEYFFHGKCEDFELAKTGSIVLYCPLQNEEGWDWAFQDSRLLPNAYLRYWKSNLNSNHEKFFWDNEARLRFFDYFHPTTYQPVIKSRVPVGRDKEFIAIDVDVCELFAMMCGRMGNYLRRGLPSVLLHRLDYFFSCLDELGDLSQSNVDVVSDCRHYVERFARQYYNFTPKKKLDDDSQQKAFLTRFHNHIANNPVHPSIKTIWQKVVDEHER